MSKTWIIRQYRRGDSRLRKQRETLIGLGLGRIGKKSERKDHPAIRGMIARVHHLIKIEQDGSK